jgi:hypothetical protein
VLLIPWKVSRRKSSDGAGRYIRFINDDETLIFIPAASKWFILVSNSDLCAVNPITEQTGRRCSPHYTLFT